MSGNVCSPVIECPPMSGDRGAEGVCAQRLSSGGYDIITLTLHQCHGVSRLSMCRRLKVIACNSTLYPTACSGQQQQIQISKLHIIKLLWLENADIGENAPVTSGWPMYSVHKGQVMQKAFICHVVFTWQPLFPLFRSRSFHFDLPRSSGSASCPHPRTHRSHYLGSPSFPSAELMDLDQVSRYEDQKWLQKMTWFGFSEKSVLRTRLIHTRRSETLPEKVSKTHDKQIKPLDA